MSGVLQPLFGAAVILAIAIAFSTNRRAIRWSTVAWGLGLQGVWASALVLPRTFDPVTNTYGNLYSNLLDYVISAALIFYILTIYGVFRLRRLRPEAERPYRALGFPIVPALYIAGAATILLVLFVYRTATTWPGLVIVMLGLPVYFLWRPRS